MNSSIGKYVVYDFSPLGWGFDSQSGEDLFESAADYLFVFKEYTIEDIPVPPQGGRDKVLMKIYFHFQ
jgi:hypothetical protein